MQGKWLSWGDSPVYSSGQARLCPDQGWISCPSSSLGWCFIGMTTAGAKFHVEKNYQDLWQFGELMRRKNHFFISSYWEFHTFWVVEVDVKVEWPRRQHWEQGVGVACSWNLFHAAGGVTQVTAAAKYLLFPDELFAWSDGTTGAAISMLRGRPHLKQLSKNGVAVSKKQVMGKDLFLNTWDSWRIPVSLTNITHWNYLAAG